VQLLFEVHVLSATGATALNVTPTSITIYEQ
jgi:hypothetical protein